VRRNPYIHQRPDWPAFRWNSERLATQLAAVRHHQGRLLGRMEALGFRLGAETALLTLTQDTLKTSEIEGKLLDPEGVRSSLARRLGLEKGGIGLVDRAADAIVSVLLDATRNFDQGLTAER
jgi:Fic family protein